VSVVGHLPLSFQHHQLDHFALPDVRLLETLQVASRSLGRYLLMLFFFFGGGGLMIDLVGFDELYFDSSVG